jgi:hypothetical protein
MEWMEGPVNSHADFGRPGTLTVFGSTVCFACWRVKVRREFDSSATIDGKLPCSKGLLVLEKCI